MQKPISSDFKRVASAYFSGSEHAFTITLMTMLSYLYGTEFINNPTDNTPWSPEAIRMQIFEDLQITVDERVMDKIQAGILALTSDVVFDDPAVFHAVVTALYDLDQIAGEWDEPEAEEVAWGFTEIMLIRGVHPDVAEMHMDPEIKAYGRVVLENEGIYMVPKSMDFADPPRRPSEEDYSDDPTMFDSIFKEQQAKADAVDSEVNRLFTLAIQQVNALPLGKQLNLDFQSVFERSDTTVK